MVIEVAAAVASLVLAGIAVIGFAVSRSQFRVQSAAAEKQMLMLSDAVRALAAIADSQRRQVEALAQQVSASAAQAQRQIALREQQMNWNVLSGIAKVLGWVLDRDLFEDDD